MYYNTHMEVYTVRTNVVIDEKLMADAMRLSKLKTKREVIDKALYEFVAHYSRKNLLDLRGQIKFSENYDYKALREGRN